MEEEENEEVEEKAPKDEAEIEVATVFLGMVSNLGFWLLFRFLYVILVFNRFALFLNCFVIDTFCCL